MPHAPAGRSLEWSGGAVGIVARRTRVHLDANVVAGLVIDEVARTYVREARRNGADVFLSPTITSELAEAPLPKRKRLIAAAIEYCDGITSIKFEHMLALEIEGINEGKAMPEMPVLPIELFRMALKDEHPWLLGRPHPKNTKADFVAALETCNRMLHESDVLLTRDRELYECGRLVNSVLPDTRPNIRFVPQP
jgi:hypothetical protein